MKLRLLLPLLFLGVTLPSLQADVTIVQKFEIAGQTNDLTIKVKGPKIRVESAAMPTSIIDTASGNILYLNPATKQVVQISGEQTKAILQAQAGASPAAKPVLKPTGKKETINGYETEEYSCEGANFSATYAIAKNYPNAAEIARQLQAATPQKQAVSAMGIPDYRDFPGLPLRSRIKMMGNDVVSTIVAVKSDPLPDSDFVAPPDYKPMAMQDLMGGKQPPVAPSAAAPKKP